MVELTNKMFRLIENGNGHASTDTIMTFESCCLPYRANYSGPNVVHGHAIVVDTPDGLSMLYHCVDVAGALSAGKASVTLSGSGLEPAKMRLNWEWLTTVESGGVSEWIEIPT